MKYTPVIGLEIHIELNTKTKMFCGCSAQYFGKEPNTETCPICLGLPGSLPFINQEAINKCLMIGLALNCEIQEPSRFERKSYFYPDLAKGYQISQYRCPLCKQGKLVIGDRVIRINRVHQEEDTAKLVHHEGQSGVDFNRAGVPLVEIVTEPDFTTSEQVREFAKSIQQLVRYLNVSEADMEKGQLRLEANVSVGQWVSESVNSEKQELPDYRIELKNINSFSFMAKAIEYEIKRQTEELEKGVKLTQQTRGWDQTKGQTYPQREKEEAHDYRYFPEPDLPELRVKGEGERVKTQMPELPWEAKARLLKLGISDTDAEVLTATAEMTEYFEQTVKLASVENIPAKTLANLLINSKIDISKVTSSELIQQIMQSKSGVVSDENELEKICQEVVSENPELVEIYKKGKTSVLQALVGAVMRKSGGKADAPLVQKVLQKLV